MEDSSAPDRSEKPSSPSGRAEKGSSQSPQKSEGGSPDSEPQSSNASSEPQGGRKTLDKNGTYTSRDDVALYIRLYNTLPENFITKREAEALGWTGGSLEPYAPGKCIGGGRFGNYEGALPDKKGRKYWECDIDTLGRKSRGAKRIVYSNDGLIYYTGDHYKTFTLLYGEE
ncbi:MAG: ribonuclease [Clostridia bacterium]|nr:ribonuclease [Clostridia bacterium]